jgi:hypothetical protein
MIPLALQRRCPEKKASRLSSEINNGRLAMLGLISLISEAKVPGSVPLLKDLIKGYDGSVLKDPWGIADLIK